MKYKRYSNGDWYEGEYEPNNINKEENNNMEKKIYIAEMSDGKMVKRKSESVRDIIGEVWYNYHDSLITPTALRYGCAHCDVNELIKLYNELIDESFEAYIVNIYESTLIVSEDEKEHK